MVESYEKRLIHHSQTASNNCSRHLHCYGEVSITCYILVKCRYNAPHSYNLSRYITYIYVYMNICIYLYIFVSIDKYVTFLCEYNIIIIYIIIYVISTYIYVHNSRNI